MYGKPAITCFKYQVFLYGSESITYLNAILWVVPDPTVWVITLPPLRTTGSPPPLCMAALPSPIGKRTLVWLNYRTYFKKQGETGMVQKPSHVKQLSPIHVCKIGLMYLFCEEFLFICATDSPILKEAHVLLLRLSGIIPPPIPL